MYDKKIETQKLKIPLEEHFLSTVSKDILSTISTMRNGRTESHVNQRTGR
jgi:hypothetical protein